jgi:hypothetical protein
MSQSVRSFGRGSINRGEDSRGVTDEPERAQVLMCMKCAYYILFACIIRVENDVNTCFSTLDANCLHASSNIMLSYPTLLQVIAEMNFVVMQQQVSVPKNDSFFVKAFEPQRIEVKVREHTK